MAERHERSPSAGRSAPRGQPEGPGHAPRHRVHRKNARTVAAVCMLAAAARPHARRSYPRTPSPIATIGAPCVLRQHSQSESGQCGWRSIGRIPGPSVQPRISRPAGRRDNSPDRLLNLSLCPFHTAFAPGTCRQLQIQHMVGQTNVQHSSATPKTARDYLDIHSSQTNRLTRYQRCIVFSYQPDRPSFYALQPTQCAPEAKAADHVQDMMVKLHQNDQRQ